jgi:hypothetical protein
MEAKFPYKPLERSSVIRWLFDLSRPELRNDTTMEFIRTVSDTTHPIFIRSGTSEWYADLSISVIYKGQKSKLNLCLRRVRYPNKGQSWNIVSARAPFLNFRRTHADSLLLKEAIAVHLEDLTTGPFLSPSSHGIDFMNIEQFFLDGENSKFYLYPDSISFQMAKLIRLVSRNEIRFIAVDKIRYHLLQLEGWIMVVDFILRNESNSGWLIRQLIKAGPDVKYAYKKRNLGIPLE